MQIHQAPPSTLQESTQKKLAWFRIRVPIALFGIVLLTLGQFWIASETDLPNEPNPLGIWLNKKIHLEDPTIDNVLHGVPLLAIGGVLMLIGLRGKHLLPLESVQFGEGRFPSGSFSSSWLCAFAGAGIFAILLLKLTDETFQRFQVPFWLLTLILFGIVAAIWDRSRWADLSPHIIRKDWLWLLCLLIVGIVIGVYRLQGLPDQLMGDEGNFWTTARDIATGEYVPSVFSPGVYSFPILGSIAQAWLMRVFGISLWGWRFASVLLGLATVPPLYLLARETFNRRIAIISCCVLIASPYFIAFSRLGYNNIQALFFITLTAGWLYIGLGRRSNVYLYLAGIVAGLGFYTYFSARLSIVLALVFILLMCLTRKIKVIDGIQAIGFLLLGFIPVVVPYFIYGYIHDPAGMGYKISESVFFNTFNGLQFYSERELHSITPPFPINENEFFYNPQIYLVLIVRGILRTLLAIQKPGMISEHFIAFPLAGTIGAVFYVIGLLLMLRTIRSPRSQLLILLFLTNILGLSALNTVPPRHTHMITILPVFAILIAVGIYALATAISVMYWKLLKFKPLLLVGLVTVVGVGGLYDYFVTMPKQYPPTWDQTIAWAILDSHGERFFYLYENASQGEFYPYTLDEFRKTIFYSGIPVEEVLEGQRVFSEDASLIFFSPLFADHIVSILQEQWDGRLITRTFNDGDGVPVLIAAMNTPFEFERDKSFFAILRESYQQASLWLIIFTLVGCLVIAMLLPEGWSRKFAAPIQRWVEWFSVTEGFDRSDEEPSDWTEEIFLASQPTPEMTTIEPPAWIVDPIFETEAREKPNRFNLLLKPIKTDAGTDIYFKAHFPPLVRSILQCFGGHSQSEQPQFFLPAFQVPHPLWLASSIVLAVGAQILITSQQMLAGALLYIASAASMIFWIRRNPKWKNVFAKQMQLSPRAEALLVAILIVIVISTRFLDLNQRVYGLEADETKWTVQSWYSTILRQDIGEFSSMHYKPLPVDFWTRSIFLRAFGMNFLSARIESAVFSLISVIFLYLLVRLLTSSPPVALLSALFFGMSFIELNASHQALHNTPPMPWALGSLYFFFLGMRDRKLWQFQITGILLALGMLTYETFYPTIVVILVYMLGSAANEISKRKNTIKTWLSVLALVTWPVLIVYLVFTRDYMASRQPYLFGALQSSAGQGNAFFHILAYFSNNALELLETTFAQVLWSDSLINWTGPLINSYLLPFVVVGLIYNIWNIRRSHFAFILLWYLLFTLSAPILLGSVWPRVMYLAVPPIMVWGSLGLWTCLGALRGLFDYQSPRLVNTAFVLLILAILARDYQIFTRDLIDLDERQKRRELADLTVASTTAVPMTLFPYLTNEYDTVELESHVLLYSAAGARNLELNASQYYQLTEFDSLLASLWMYRDLDGLDIVFDKTSESFHEQRNRTLEVVLRCYPGALLQQNGRFFDVYRLNAQTLSMPVCYLPPAPTDMTPANSTILPTAPVTFKWNAHGIAPTGFQLILERKRKGVNWIEIEEVFQGPGWTAIDDFVNGFNGTGFLVDDWQSEEAMYAFDVLRGGDYRVWIRSYKRRENDQHNFITIGGNILEFADNGDVLDQWNWKDLGVMSLETGQSPIFLSRTYGQDEQYTVFLDSLIISSDLEFDPRVDSVWDVILDTPELGLSGNQFTPKEILAPGEYRWRVRIFDNDRIVDSTGMSGVESQPAFFQIVP